MFLTFEPVVGNYSPMVCIVVIVPSSFSRDVSTKAPRLYGRTARASIIKELEINVLLVDARAV